MFGICPHSGGAFEKLLQLRMIQDAAALQCRRVACLWELNDDKMAEILLIQFTADPTALGEGLELSRFPGASDICRDTHTRVLLLPVNLRLTENKML